MVKEPKSSGGHSSHSKPPTSRPPAPHAPVSSRPASQPPPSDVDHPPASVRTFRSRIDMGPVGMADSIRSHLKFTLARDPHTATPQDWYQSAAYAVRDRIMARFIETMASQTTSNARRVNYLSLDHLVGFTSTQLGALASTVIAGLDDSQLSSLSTTQLRGISGLALNALSPDQFDAFERGHFGFGHPRRAVLLQETLEGLVQIPNQAGLGQRAGDVRAAG